MSEESVRVRFLAAEKEASEIVEVLKQLRSEMSRYAGARESLEEAVGAIQATAQGLAPVTAKIKDLLLTLDELGFPEFRDDLTRIGQIVEELDVGQSKLQSGQARLLTEAQFSEAVKALGDSLIRSEGENAAALGKLQKLVVEGQASQKRQMAWTVSLLVILGVLIIAMSFLP